MAEIDNGSSYKEIVNYSVAPYNFASLGSKSIAAYKSINDLPGHDKIDPGLMSGYIDYEIENHTPLIVGDGRHDDNNNVYPFKDAGGKYAVPGNTIRGMVRTNAATLSLSNIIDDIADSRFYYRDFGKGSLRKDYDNNLDITQDEINGRKINRPRAIRGGIIECLGKDEYVIHPVKEINEQSYLTISEQYLRNCIDKDFLRSPEGQKIKFMYNSDIIKLITDKNDYKPLKTDSDAVKNEKNKKRKKFLHDISNKKFKPYIARISFSVKDKRNVNRIGGAGKYSEEGYLMCSEKISDKLVHYIIPSDIDDEKKSIDLTGENRKFIDFYKDDLVRTKKFTINNDGELKPNNGKEYFGFPKSGENKPVFYGEFREKIYIGFTPYLRIPYDNSIYDGIDEMYKSVKGISFADSIFGFSKKNGEERLSYKSRVSFEDASIINAGRSEREYDVILGEPHASAYPLYLKQDDDAASKEIVNYNTEGFKIRGIKHYFLKNYVTIISSDEQGNGKVISRLHPISEGARFKGRIYYKNLKKEELGLILWSLKPAPNARDNIGMGRPYGFGNIEIKNIKAYSENLKKKYSSASEDYFEDVDIGGAVKSYKSYIQRRHGVDINYNEGVQDLISLKTTIVDKGHANDVRYMKIGSSKKKVSGISKNEFTELHPLPSIKRYGEMLSGAYIRPAGDNSRAKNKHNNRKPHYSHYNSSIRISYNTRKKR